MHTRVTIHNPGGMWNSKTGSLYVPRTEMYSNSVPRLAQEQWVHATRDSIAFGAPRATTPIENTHAENYRRIGAYFLMHLQGL